MGSVAVPSPAVGAMEGTRPRRRHLRRFLVLMSGCLLLAVVLAAIAAPYLAPASPTAVHIIDRLKPPGTLLSDGRRAWLGTDEIGRDILSRLIYGGRASLIVAASAVVVAGAIGLWLGLVAGYFGGKADMLLMRLVDIQLAFPEILLALAIIGAAGPSVPNLILTIGITRWVSYARVVRGSVLSLREKEFVEAVRAMGASTARILFRHIMPQLVSSMVILATIEFGRVIIVEASLSFLGLGIQPPTPSWGGMVSAGRAYLYNAWWIATIPGLLIALVALAASFVGDAIRDRLDPHMKGI